MARFRGATSGKPANQTNLSREQRKRGPKVYAELRKLGVAEDVAVRVAANTRRWWCNSAMFVHVGLDTRYYDRIGVPKLAR